MQISATQSTGTQRTVVLRGCTRRVHEPRVECDDDEALVLQLESKLRRGNEAGGLRHAVSDHVHHAEGERARGVRCAGANDDDLLCVRRAEEREERCDAVDRAQTINLILCDEAIA